MKRRDFMSSMIAAPFVVRSGVLMPIRPQIITQYGPIPEFEIIGANFEFPCGKEVRVGRYIPFASRCEEAALVSVNRPVQVYVSGFLWDAKENGLGIYDPTKIVSWHRV